LRFVAFILAAASSVSCGGADGGVTAPSNIASIVINGAPTAPMLAGSTVQLTATPINSTGAVVGNATLSWRSSDPGVASVSGGGLMTAVGMGTATITTSGGSVESSVTVNVRAGVQVDASGATLNLLNGAIVLQIPANAFFQSTTVTVAPGTNLAANARLLPATAFDIGSLQCNINCTLALRYDPAKLPANVSEASLQLYAQFGASWRVMPGSTLNTTTKTVSAPINYAGTYAIVGTAVDHLTLGGAAGSAILAGQVARVNANAFDASNNPLTGRAVTWTSSDVSKATVNASGDVTAVAVGSVTITATSEGTSASTGITILARVSADWSQVTPWTTFQGNGAHTGYVPVTADPAVFAKLWAGTVGTGAIAGVVEGGSRVFATTTGYFTPGAIKAFDYNSGAVSWTVPLGSNNATMAPAYAGGTVIVQTNDIASYLWSFDEVTGATRFRVGYTSQWSRYLAPVIVGQTVYHGCGYGDGLCATSTTDGALLWTSPTNQYDGWTPAVVGGIAYTYTGEYSPKVTAVDITNGKTLYEIADSKFSWNGWTMNGAPVIDNGRLLATQAGRLVSFDLANRKLEWEVDAAFTGNVTVASGVIFVANTGQVEARSETDGSLLWIWIPPEGRVSSPIIATRNLLFVSTQTNTYAVDISSHRHVWSYNAVGELAIGASGTLYIGQSSGVLAAIKLK
jgi:Bacterial Ig-like domain (group 2)